MNQSAENATELCKRVRCDAICVVVKSGSNFLFSALIHCIFLKVEF